MYSDNQPQHILNTFTQYWLNQLENELPKEFCYHRSEHTLMVIDSVVKMANYYGFSQRAKQLLQVSALFHDMGYLEDYANHELRGAKMLREAKKDLDFSDNEIDFIAELILKTEINKRPINLMQSILRDADVSYLGRKDATLWGNLLKREYINLGKIDSEYEFAELERKFLKKHRFSTLYGQIMYGPGKRKYSKIKDKEYQRIS